MRYLLFILAFASAWGQVEDYGRTANAAAIYDLTAAAITRAIKSGASDPATCTSGKDLFINTSSTPVIKLCTATNTWTALGSSSMIYPGAGVANSTGSAWGSSLTVGTSPNNLVQLNGSGQLPAVSGALLTNLPAPATLATPRAIYGNNFDGSAALTQIIASTYGGTGNGFTKFSGPATSEKTFTLPNASATILTDNAPVTVAQGGTGVATLTGIVKASGTSNFAAAGYADIVGLWTTCTGFLKNDGTCASAGSGTVTVVSSGSLTSTALVTGGGTTTLQTPSATATLDSSGNISTPGSITTGAGGSNAGVLELTQGTAPTAGTTSVKLYAPASVTSYIMNLPGAAATGYLYGTNSSGVVTQSFRSIQAGDVPTLNQNTTGSAATLTTPRAIYGNNFDGSAALTQVIASTYGGTGNGFAKFSGPATAEKTFTLPNASASILTDNAAVTVAQGGTGVGTLTGIIKGNGTSAFTAATAGTDYVSPSSTETFTHKTLDAEGAGNSITIPVKLWLPAVGCAGTTGTLMWDTLASNAPTATCSAGGTETTMMRGVADFPDSDGAYSLQQPILLPDDWSGAVDIKFLYRTTATTGNTVWQVATSCRADAEVDDAAFNTADALTADAAKGTTNQLNAATKTGITTTGCAAGELMHLKVLRDRTHASDTITGVISLVGVEVTLRRAM